MRVGFRDFDAVRELDAIRIRDFAQMKMNLRLGIRDWERLNSIFPFRTVGA